MIPKENLIKHNLYTLRSRNLTLGVFDGKKGFIGIRTKFNEQYLFTEYYSDGNPYSTATPLENLGPIPTNIEVKEYQATIDQYTNRPIHFDKPIIDGGKGWIFSDTNTPSIDICPLLTPNKILFDYLKEREKQIKASQIQT